MKTRNLAWGGLSSLTALLSLSALAGCELITAPDHDLIGQGGSTSSNGGGGGTTTTSNGGGGAGGATTSTGGAGGGPECTGPGDCPTPGNDCKKADCDASSMCAEVDKDPGDTCASSGGTKCDGAGNCVECIVAGDCPVNGSTCDASGQCVSPLCMNSMKDTTNEETDVDCGGTICPACVNTKDCALGTDCESGFCSSLKCAACTMDTDCGGGNYCDTGVCKPKQSDGTTCTATNQCSGACVTIGTGMVCCDSACTGGANGCKSCDGALTGGMDGKCIAVTANTDPKNNCDDTCTNGCVAGICDNKADTTTCGMGPSCMGTDALNPQDHCQTGTCTSPVATDCGVYSCDSTGNVCNMGTCTAHADCDSTHFCGGVGGAGGTAGDCTAKGIIGTPCAVNEECVMNNCDTAVTGLCI